MERGWVCGIDPGGGAWFGGGGGGGGGGAGEVHFGRECVHVVEEGDPHGAEAESSAVEKDAEHDSVPCGVEEKDDDGYQGDGDVSALEALDRGSICQAERPVRVCVCAVEDGERAGGQVEKRDGKEDGE